MGALQRLDGYISSDAKRGKFLFPPSREWRLGMASAVAFPVPLFVISACRLGCRRAALMMPIKESKSASDCMSKLSIVDHYIGPMNQ